MQESFKFPPNVLYENRYCNQDNFSVLVCGGFVKRGSKLRINGIVNSVYKLDCPKFESKKYASMPNSLIHCKTAVVNSELFILGGYSQNKKLNKLIMKFCNKNKTWLLNRNYV